MCRLVRWAFVAVIVAASWACTDQVAGRELVHAVHRQPPQRAAPPYITLQRGGRGRVLAAPVTRYAYGWFGAKPGRQCVRHFGYYRNYTQWTAR